MLCFSIGSKNASEDAARPGYKKLDVSNNFFAWIMSMNKLKLEKDEELKAIEFSKLTVGEIYSFSQWISNEEDNDFNQFRSQANEFMAKDKE